LYDVERLIHTSTSEVYGTALYAPIDENHPLQAQSPYAASKIAADKMVESYVRTYDQPVSVVRPFNTYGPRQSARAVIPTIIVQALLEQDIKLGAVEPVRDLTYVGDTVSGFLKVAQSEQTIGEIVNIGNGKGIRIGDLCRLLLEIMNKQNLNIISEDQRLRPEKSEVLKLICGNEKASALCDWEPACTLRRGLEKTVQWIQGNVDQYKASLYNL
jgi:nucleoside-diphosphate-sugar epimerase